MLVAPPRGERGLKCKALLLCLAFRRVAPPRGERGLKCLVAHGIKLYIASLPLVGSVD